MPRKGVPPLPDWLADASLRRRFRRRLLRWYRRNARDLPWRRTRDAYQIWVSEIMLQQTQVATVVPYFERFIARFPTIAALAAASEDDVLRLWEGLGYYRRARQLHHAAGKVVSDHGGRFPQDPRIVRRLRGIGRYTAGAILSIAFEAKEPILEANTIRLWSRLLAYQGDPRRGEGQRLLWRAAAEVLPRKRPGEFNQALMELGGEICRPYQQKARTPRCDVCPVAEFCQANRLSLQRQIPQVEKRPAIEQIREAAVAVRRKGKFLLIKRTGEQRWAGLWDFPRFAISAVVDDANMDDVEKEIRQELRLLTGIEVQTLSPIATLRHSVTRFRITLDCYAARWRCAAGQRPEWATNEREMKWIKPGDIADLPLSVTGRKLSHLVAEL